MKTYSTCPVCHRTLGGKESLNRITPCRLIGMILVILYLSFWGVQMLGILFTTHRSTVNPIMMALGFPIVDNYSCGFLSLDSDSFSLPCTVDQMANTTQLNCVRFRHIYPPYMEDAQEYVPDFYRVLELLNQTCTDELERYGTCEDSRVFRAILWLTFPSSAYLKYCPQLRNIYGRIFNYNLFACKMEGEGMIYRGEGRWSSGP